MAEVKSGRVKKVYDNTFDDGGRSVSFLLEGDRTYYRTGKNRFDGIVEQGAVIKFQYERVNDKACKVIGTPKKGGSSDAPPAAVGDAGRGFGTNDAAIRYQSSRKDALEMANLALAAGALKLPAKDADKLAVLEAVVDRYTAAFYADIETKGAVARVTPAKTEKVREPGEDDEPVEAETGDDDEWA